MSKWRPTALNCIYVIPDIHGAFWSLKNICDRILPLRKSDGGKDRIIFLGDYIDYHKDSHLVIDFLIDLKNLYGDRVVFLKGDHEDLFLKAINCHPEESSNSTELLIKHQEWMELGGSATLLGYMERAGISNPNPFLTSALRTRDFVPKEHIEFIRNNLLDYYEYENFIFVHAGCNPLIDLKIHTKNVFYKDESLFNFIIKSVNTKTEIPWGKTIITGHHRAGKPFINEKFMMLDINSPETILVLELRSMEAYKLTLEKQRMVKVNLQETYFWRSK